MQHSDKQDVSNAPPIGLIFQNIGLDVYVDKEKSQMCTVKTMSRIDNPSEGMQTVIYVPPSGVVIRPDWILPCGIGYGSTYVTKAQLLPQYRDIKGAVEHTRLNLEKGGWMWNHSYAILGPNPRIRLTTAYPTVLAEQRAVALSMAFHERLGKDSVLNVLNESFRTLIVPMIQGEFYTRYAEWPIRMQMCCEDSEFKVVSSSQNEAKQLPYTPYRGPNDVGQKRLGAAAGASPEPCPRPSKRVKEDED